MTKPQNQKLAITRWLEKIQVHSTSCWLWVGCIHPINRYGQFSYNKRLSSPHRFAYEYFIGSIPDGYEVDHLCRVRHCCNPLHLEAVTVQENRRRRNAHITHCKHGHSFSADNTYWHNGHRHCRECNAIRQAEHRRKVNS